MLEIKNLTLTLAGSGRKIVEDFTFTLNRGDRAVLIGEEGNGKSTLLKHVYDPRLTEGYCDSTGRVLRKGRVGYLPQLLPEELRKTSVASLFEGAEPTLYRDTLRSIGLPTELAASERPLGTLSGGEKVKVQLARLLMDAPDLLLLDEPTNDLDIETLEWLEGFLLKADVPVLFVSHDETLIENTANVIVHLEQLHGKSRCRTTVARTGYAEYVRSRRSALDHQDQVARKQREDYKKQMDRWRQIHDRVEHEQNVISRADPAGGRLLKKKMKSVLAQGRRFEREAENFEELPEEESAILTFFPETVTLPRGKVVLDLDLPELSVGEKVLSRNLRLKLTGPVHLGIVGRNGAGKSTLLKVLWELLRERTDLRAAYMPQDYSEALDYKKSAVEYLAESFHKDDVTRARSHMACMRFRREEMTGPMGELSGGQRAKILLLEMVLREANVLLLDEPTRNFSPLSAPVVRKALREYGGAVISVSHDRKYLQEVCDRLVELTSEGFTEL